MSAIRREIKEVETQLSEQEDIYSGLNEQLRVLQQDRSNVEEELVAHNTRLRQMLDELAMRKEAASKEQEGLQYLKTSKRTMQELNRKVDEIVASVLEHKFKDDGFQQAIMEQNVGSCGDKVRVEFEGDEVFWSLRENYTFEMLLQDAARYWDVSPMDAALMDERGAIWPDDFYVALELQNAPAARILLRIKATAAAQEEEPEFYGAEDDLSEISDEEEQDFMAIAEAAEDELLLAQARGTATTLTSKQKLALRRKMRRELLYFLAFVLLFVYVLYARRDVRNGFFMQQSIATAFIGENFGDYNEKAYEDIATAEEVFDWMGGPLQDGLYADEYYNDLEVPDDRRGYVMSYNKVVGKVRLRQLRVRRDGCSLSSSVRQSGTLLDGTARQRQLIDYCYPPYDLLAKDDQPFGPEELNTIDWKGFKYTTAEQNKLVGTSVQGQVTAYDGSGYVLDLDGANRTAYLETLQGLIDNKWIDKQTRAVLISLNLYSGNYDVICLMTFIIEFTHGGSVVPSFKQRILATDIFHPEYYQGWNLATSLPEILVYVCILAYVVHFLYRMGRTKRVTGALRNHFRDKWNLVEVVWFALMMSAIAMRLSYFLDPFRLDFDIRVTDYQELANLAFLYQLQFIIDAMTVLMFAIKSIKFFALQKDLNVLKGTLAQAIGDLQVFVVLMLTILAGFVIMALNIFGTQAEPYKNFLNAFGTLFLILLGALSRRLALKLALASTSQPSHRKSPHTPARDSLVSLQVNSTLTR